jgi:hypothetical protein
MSEELIATPANEAMIKAGVIQPGQIMASFDVTTDDGQIALWNATSAADDKIDNHIEETLEICDYVVEAIEVLNEQTGEVECRPHVTIILTDGTSLDGQSKTLPADLANLFKFRNVSEDNPALVKIVKKKAKLGSMFKIKLVKE